MTLIQNDIREVADGFASFGSRSLQVGGGALWLAAKRLVAQAQALGTDVTELARRAGPLRAGERFRPPQSFPFGTYAAVVEIDTELGGVTIRALVAVDGYGVVVNPMVVDGQGYGSIAQGLGQALYEEARYGPDGSPGTETLLDYLLSTAAEMPPVTLEETVIPNPNSPVGAKGAGEAGCIGAPPAVVNAVCDALQVDHVDMPLTPEAVWRAAHEKAAE